jgi:hypothetical protein
VNVGGVARGSCRKREINNSVSIRVFVAITTCRMMEGATMCNACEVQKARNVLWHKNRKLGYLTDSDFTEFCQLFRCSLIQQDIIGYRHYEVLGKQPRNLTRRKRMSKYDKRTSH